jgi:hypothetical protein
MFCYIYLFVFILFFLFFLSGPVHTPHPPDRGAGGGGRVSALALASRLVMDRILVGYLILVLLISLVLMWLAMLM